MKFFFFLFCMAPVEMICYITVIAIPTTKICKYAMSGTKHVSSHSQVKKQIN